MSKITPQTAAEVTTDTTAAEDEKPFVEYGESNYFEEESNTCDMIMKAIITYAESISDPCGENEFKADVARNQMLNEIDRLYKERAALIRIVLKLTAKQAREEYAKLVEKFAANEVA